MLRRNYVAIFCQQWKGAFNSFINIYICCLRTYSLKLLTLTYLDTKSIVSILLHLLCQRVILILSLSNFKQILYVTNNDKKLPFVIQ